MIGYYNCFKDGNKTMSFRCDDKKTVKKYERIWEKISSIVNKNLLVNPLINLIIIHI